MSSRRHTRLRLFAQGSRALQLVTGEAQTYRCPLCEDPYAQDDAATGRLTIEHVPPTAQDDLCSVLTCRECNNTAGHTIDAQAKNRELFLNFVEGLAGKRRVDGARATWSYRGERLNVDLSADPDSGGIFATVPRDRNDPSGIRRILTALTKAASDPAWDGKGFALGPPVNPDLRQAAIGNLRTAFLLAFAKWGYTYAFHPEVWMARSQILNPDETLIQGFTIDAESSCGVPRMALAAEPFPAVLVTFRDQAVLLPWVSQPLGFYDSLRQLGHGCVLQFSGTQVQLPHSLEMTMDFEKGIADPNTGEHGP